MNLKSDEFCFDCAGKVTCLKVCIATLADDFHTTSEFPIVKLVFGKTVQKYPWHEKLWIT